MSRRKTLTDVAKLAGVGKVTVSYVLNGRATEARISPETTERVLAAAKDLDYRPNALARMLLRQRTDTIAVVFQYADYFSSSSSFTADVMRGVCAGCVEAGFDLMLHTKAACDVVAEADALTDGRVDGALVLRDEHDEMIELMIARGFPMVLFFSRSDHPGVPFVDLDNFMGGKLAVNHLLELGHRRIAMLRGSPHSISSNDRHSGYRHALEGAGIAYDPRLGRSRGIGRFLVSDPGDDEPTGPSDGDLLVVRRRRFFLSPNPYRIRLAGPARRFGRRIR